MPALSPAPPAPSSEIASPEGKVHAFRFEGLRGQVLAAAEPPDLEAEVRRLIDPAAATESLHWGRNYLYRAELGSAGSEGIPVVVKLFRGDRLKERWRQRWRGTKARLSWDMARAFLAAGVATPEPLLLIESEKSDGPAFYVCRHLDGVTEARYLLRAAARGKAAEEFPRIDLAAFLETLGATARRMHDAGILHRDLSVGNVLIEPHEPGEPPRLWLVDLNRAKRGGRLGMVSRLRDLCRLALFRAEDREHLLRGYYGGAPSAGAISTYSSLHHLFQLRNRVKAPLAPVRKKLRNKLTPRKPHAHIPDAPEGASKRDKVVWDYLSDQPHQHASRAEKAAIRFADLRGHLEEGRVLAGTLPRVWKRYRQLQTTLGKEPVPWNGMGLALRPQPEDPEGLLAAVDDLGVRRLLLRLHPWQTEHDAEEELAKELVSRGYELAFALPQNRDLVRDRARWCSSIEELGERFSPYGHHFQIGQAINRSKWGIWRAQEYVELYQDASEILRRHEGVELLGPSVIDFEHHVTAAVLNLKRPGLRFDIVSALLYVDRRGAPENQQAGFDTIGKTALLKAIADTSRNGVANGTAEKNGARCWITEFNWPLWEGPHSPAGKGVSVDEEAHADYSVRYFLLTLATGLVERVYFWQLAARGYGLLAPTEEGHLGEAHQRPAFAAIATLHDQIEGATFEEKLPAPEGAYLYRFTLPEGGRTVVGWTTGSPDSPSISATLPSPVAEVRGRDGQSLTVTGSIVELTSSPTYFRLAES